MSIRLRSQTEQMSDDESYSTCLFMYTVRSLTDHSIPSPASSCVTTNIRYECGRTARRSRGSRARGWWDVIHWPTQFRLDPDVTLDSYGWCVAWAARGSRVTLDYTDH